MRNLNQELEEQIKKLKDDKQSQDERFEKIQNNNNLLENKLVQIQNEASNSPENKFGLRKKKQIQIRSPSPKLKKAF